MMENAGRQKFSDCGDYSIAVIGATKSKRV
jgi:hypothetical protein